MKQLIVTLFLSIFLISCDNETENNTNNINVTTVNEYLRSGNGLLINEFIEDGITKTSLTSGFVFNFSENGNVIATKNDEIINGTYLVFRDDNKTELRMTFPNNSILFELSDDWYFVSQNATTIRFEDNGDKVVFEKL